MFRYVLFRLPVASIASAFDLHYPTSMQVPRNLSHFSISHLIRGGRSQQLNLPVTLLAMPMICEPIVKDSPLCLIKPFPTVHALDISCATFLRSEWRLDLTLTPRLIRESEP
jgi:hypothetical protein